MNLKIFQMYFEFSEYLHGNVCELKFFPERQRECDVFGISHGGFGHPARHVLRVVEVGEVGGWVRQMRLCCVANLTILPNQPVWILCRRAVSDNEESSANVHYGFVSFAIKLFGSFFKSIS